MTKAENRMGCSRDTMTPGILGLGFTLLTVCILVPPVLAQDSKRQPPGKSSGDKKSPGANTRKMSDQERRQERARAKFADAANAQNNGAYDVAIELWTQMIEEFPDNPLSSSARHFLGVCYQEQDPPNYSRAIESFRSAVKDTNLKEREESLINLGWCLYQKSVMNEPIDKESLTEAARSFAYFLDKYPDSPLADKAMFYAGEAESRLGKTDRAIAFYNQLIQNRGLAKSTLRPDAMFALGISYEEAQQPKLAAETYDAFLAAFPKHSLLMDASIRLAELALQNNQADRAVELFEKVIDQPAVQKMAIADYIYYRYAFALAKTGQFAKSADAYQKLTERFPKSQYATNAALAIGQTLLRDKKYDEAARAFERLLPYKDERSVEAAHWICQIAILRGQAEDAIPIAREAMQWASKLDPKTTSPANMNMLALLRMDLADGLYATAEGKAEARKLYEQIAVESVDLPICPRATYNAAFAALQAGDHAQAQRWSEAFAKRFPNDELAPDVAYVRAESLLQLSQFESASTAFEQLVRSAPDNPSVPAWELRAASAKYLGGNFEGAISMASKSLKRKMEPALQAEALFLQGSSHLKLDRFPDAITAFNQSSQADATWSQADETLLLLAQAYDANKDKDGSKKTLERLLKEFPNSRFRQQAEFRLGQISAAAKDFETALTWYDRVLSQSIEPNLGDYVRFDKAFVLIQTNRFAEALELLDVVLASSKNAALLRECSAAKAICLRRTNRAGEAIELLEQLKASGTADSGKAKILYELGLSYSAEKNYPKAIQAFEQLAKSHPDYELIDRSYFELAWALQSAGDHTTANAWFQKLTQRFPNSPLAAESFFHLGQAEFENQKFDSAVKAYTVAATKTASSELQEKSLYKLGLSHFQLRDYAAASDQFAAQLKTFPKGSLNVDARLMIAECSLKLERFTTAWPQYEQARKALESESDASAISDQVKALIYLHGAQAARELKRWNDVDAWITRMQSTVPGSNLEAVGKYELAFAKQNLKKNDEAIRLYEELAENERNALGARSRFMMGEIYFADRNFAKAISEFQKVMYGYGGTQAPDEVKNWQARSAFEAGRCTEVFIADLSGERKKKAIETALNFYNFIATNHPEHELATQADQRIAELKK